MASTESENRFDDVAILDVTSDADAEDQQPLLAELTENKQSTTPATNADTVRVPSISSYRPTNILRVLFFIEFAALLIIWFIGE